MSAYYNTFRNHPFGATSAGWVFEFRMHQVLQERRTIQLVRMHGHVAQVNYIYETPTAPDQTTVHLAVSTEVDIVEATKAQLKRNQYYRPESTTFPAIDSLLLIPTPNGDPTDVLLMFQITRNRTDHDVNQKGLEWLGRLKLPSNTRKYFVVVTPEGIHPKITAPIKYFEDAGMGGVEPDEAFPVFQSFFNTETIFKG